MSPGKLSRREFLESAGAAAALGLLGGGASLSLIPGAAAAPGKPIPPLSVMYYGTHQEYVEFWRKAAIDLKRIGLTTVLNPAASATVITKTKAHDFGDIGGIYWAAIPNRLDPSFYLEELLHSAHSVKGSRNFGKYRSAKYDAVCDAQNQEMDMNKRQKLVWEAQAIAAADYPIWWLFHPIVISAYNKRDFEGAVEIMGCGYGLMHTMWSYLKMRPKTGRKTLRSGYTKEIDSLNPFTATSSPNRQFLRFFYDTFAQIGTDLKPQPWAAESWKVVNPTAVDLVLRKGMKFHDGRPVTGEDVRFTFDYLAKWDFPNFKQTLDVIKGVEVKGWNIRFNLKKPFAPLFFTTLTDLFILPKHIWEKIPQSVGLNNPGKYLNPNPIGSGPFKFGHWRKGQEIYFKANKDHFAAPALDDFYFKIIPSEDGLAGALERGEIDISQHSLTSAMADRLKAFPFLQVGNTPSHGVYEMRPDLEKKPFDDVHFRKALYHAFDRRPFVNYFGGGVQACNTPITPLHTFWHNPNVPAPEYSIDKARAVLQKAGYTWDSQGNLCFPL